MTTASRRRGRRAATALAAVPLVALAACSTGGQRLTETGFLSDYSQMAPTKEHKKASIYVAPDYTASDYTKVIVDPVEWHAPARSDKVQARLIADFHERLVRSFGTRYEVVGADQAGPGVLRVRGAITGTRPSRWYYNVPAQVAQVALGGIGLFRPSAGGASQELQAQDAVTGRPLVKLATFRNGKPWHVSGSYVPYDHARGAFNDASKLLTALTSQPASNRVRAAASTAVAAR
ncbi:Protein of unknown function [Sphingomonas guangdongensis]|uniref:DUF3313 domain-containing protein n=1 Tax=Sphingomonas guangdongensis TaxID=1141890 RepID=A0A285QC61_9SPHN|nr:DUF3313 domain-containing protein [Sphingomonas guangdongensis]SOB79108.1 Protein of unknown function [Sphingomonas guangdongensis]